MIKVQIEEKDWKNLDEFECKPETPYWFKLNTGNIILAIYTSNGYVSGWAEVILDNENSALKIKPNSFYILRGAMIQPAILNDQGNGK